MDTKKLFTIITLCVIISVSFGCERKTLPFCDGETCLIAAPSESGFCCPFIPFMDNLFPRTFFQYYEDSIGKIVQPHVIKVEVLSETFRHARKFRVVEDLAGNFSKDINTLIVWGAPSKNEERVLGSHSFSTQVNLACSDCFRNGQTLIMTLPTIGCGSVLLNPNLNLNLPELELEEYAWVLTSHHSMPIGCGIFMLRYRNGFVTGAILIDVYPIFCDIGKDVIRPMSVRTRMSWRDFQRELRNRLETTN